MLKPQISEPDSRYQCGSLIYSKAGLFTLFAWLLWGDFCFTLMETVWPNILPLLLKGESASNLVISVFMITVPSFMNFVLNPIISTTSDRLRTSRGRRIPFILAGTPFITVLLVLLGFSHQLGGLMYRLLSGTFPGLSISTVAVGTLCSLIVAFRFFELFVNTTFWFLFNDVVPVAFMGRFLGLFRSVGSLAGALFNFVLYKHAITHTSLIFGGAALCYGSAFMMLSLNVKEGLYPPPEPITEKKPTLLDYIKVFARECFSHRIFRLVFTYTTMIGLLGGIGVFGVFMVLSLGLTLADLGNINGFAGLGGILLMYPMGSLIDRFHPIRVLLVAQIGFITTEAIYLLFLFFHFSTTVTFWIYAIGAGIGLPFYLALQAAALPLAMRIFPKERFGQFCAANAMCGALGAIAGGTLAGAFLDLMKSIFPHGDYYYRFVPVWLMFFVGLAAVATFSILREWKKLGGDESYTPPNIHKSPETA